MSTVDRRTSLAALASAGLVLCFVLVRFPPEHYGFYPVCPIYAWTGLLCPGCGGTRAVAALLHGNLREALRLNALVVGLIPVGVIYGAVARLRNGWVSVPRGVWVGLWVVTGVFTIVRNLMVPMGQTGN